MYDSASYPLYESTAKVIASIMHSETRPLKMSVTTGKQINRSNCVVLAIAVVG